MHEEGLADPELVQDHERDRFAGTSAGREDDRGVVREDDRGVTPAADPTEQTLRDQCLGRTLGLR
jgi:hypothetical protein